MKERRTHAIVTEGGAGGGPYIIQLSVTWTGPDCGTTHIQSGFRSVNLFTECVFSNIHSGENEGGVIYYYSDGYPSFSFILCQFTNTSVSREGYSGGALCIATATSLVFEKNIFCNSSAGNAGSMRIQLISSCIFISNCSFENSSVSDYAGGVFLVEFILADPLCPSHSSFGTIFGCSFVCCSSVKTGGGLRIQRPQEEGCVKSCLFHSCFSSELNGGGISFNTLSEEIEDKIILYFSFFSWKRCNKWSRCEHWNRPFLFPSFLILLFYFFFFFSSLPSSHHK
jgi:hypothetical protein